MEESVIERKTFNKGFAAELDCLRPVLYNHMNPANVRYMANEDRQALQFMAARNIERDEELFINYASDGGAIESADEQSWFSRMGVELQRNDS
ncbi:MAG: hypothetical protein QOI59_4714 [Gammaproteobacteria bacterium]|nr:hypothetical protein [Gammaproteobacteria bacterium]